MIINKQEYYKEITSLSQDIWAEALNQADNDKDEAHNLIKGILCEVLDHHQWLNTNQHYYGQIMRYSMNSDAYLDIYDNESLGDYVRDNGVDGLHVTMSRYAMYQDVTDNIYEFLAS